MFKVLIEQTQHNLSDAPAEFMLRDRLSWMRFAGFDLGAATPDENTIRHFRNKLIDSGTLTDIMGLFDALLRTKGFLPMSGQIVDASLVPAPSPRNTDREKVAIKAGRTVREIWPDQPAKAAQKDTNARWTRSIGGKTGIGRMVRRCRRSPCRCSATRPVSASIAASASSAGVRSLRPWPPTAGCCPR
jgi:IS5 family transposase